VDVSDLKRGLKVEAEAAAAGEVRESVVLLLRPDRLPRAVVTDARGVVRSRVISYVDLLATLDRSVVVGQLEKEPTRTLSLPALPPGALLVDLTERASGNAYTVTGTCPPAEHLFALEQRDETTTYRINMPRIAYRALWHEKKRCVTELSLALLSPELEGEPTPETELYRWPFSNVYSTFGGVREGVCWYGKERIELSLSEIPEKLVRRFASVPNDADRYSADLTHNAPYGSYAGFLEAIEEGGGIEHEWLVPCGMTMEQLHRQDGRED
jgi:hypothetical protein